MKRKKMRKMPRFAKEDYGYMSEYLSMKGSMLKLNEKLPKLIDIITGYVISCSVIEKKENPCYATSKAEKKQGSSSIKEAVLIWKRIGDSFDRFDPGNANVRKSITNLVNALRNNSDFGSKYADRIWFSLQDVSVKELSKNIISVLERMDKIYF